MPSSSLIFNLSTTFYPSFQLHYMIINRRFLMWLHNVTYNSPRQHLVPERSSLLKRKQNSACRGKTLNYSHVLNTVLIDSPAVGVQLSLGSHELNCKHCFHMTPNRLRHEVWGNVTLLVNICVGMKASLCTRQLCLLAQVGQVTAGFLQHPPN